MKTIKTLLSLALVALTAFGAQAKKEKTPQTDYVPLPASADASRQYGNLDYGLRIQVRNSAGDYNFVDLSQLPSKDAAKIPAWTLERPLTESTEQYAASLASQLGFKLGHDYNTDYVLRLNITDFRLRFQDANVKKNTARVTGTVVATWELLNPDREVVISSNTVTGRRTANTINGSCNAIVGAWTDALTNIGWDQIAGQLKKGRTAREEKNKQVTGAGNTALESTVIRWYITSRPQGADVSWRVVSSTPDVANTNSNYVGTTPYETTESFDIKGLTYNNSGNVQIEVTCERPGYLPQKKRFNLKQVIDQKEISAKFNMVKEDAEDAE